MQSCFCSDWVKTKRKTIFFLLLLAPVFIEMCLLFAQAKISEADLKKVLPEADFFVYRNEPFPRYEGQKGKQGRETELVGFAFSTRELYPEEKGYNGPIDMLVGMDLSGRLVGMKILKHRETPSYTAKIYSKEFQGRFIGKSVYEPMQAGVDIDAITRATITTDAIARSVRKSMRLVAGEILEFENLPREPGILDEFKRGQIYLTLAVLIFATGAFLSRREVLRWLALAISFVYLGFIKGNFISIVNFINLANFKLPRLIGNLYWYIFLIFVLAITLLWGRVYCGYLCPFGIICSAIKKLPAKRLKISFSLNKKASYLKSLILTVLLLIYLSTRNEGLFNYEVFVTLFTLYRSYMAWLLVAVSVLAMLSCVSYFWCRYLCPAGSMLGIISRISLFKQKLDCPEPGCRICSLECPTGCIDPDKKTIFFQECIRCNVCINKCPCKNRSSFSEDNEKG